MKHLVFTEQKRYKLHNSSPIRMRLSDQQIDPIIPCNLFPHLDLKIGKFIWLVELDKTYVNIVALVNRF